MSYLGKENMMCETCFLKVLYVLQLSDLVNLQLICVHVWVILNVDTLFLRVCGLKVWLHNFFTSLTTFLRARLESWVAIIILGPIGNVYYLLQLPIHANSCHAVSFSILHDVHTWLVYIRGSRLWNQWQTNTRHPVLTWYGTAMYARIGRVATAEVTHTQEAKRAIVQSSPATNPCCAQPDDEALYEWEEQQLKLGALAIRFFFGSPSGLTRKQFWREVETIQKTLFDEGWMWGEIICFEDTGPYFWKLPKEESRRDVEECWHNRFEKRVNMQKDFEDMSSN